MSRIGKAPIPVPSGVEVTINGSDVAVKGPKGSLAWSVPEDITVTRDGDTLTVTRPDDERQHRALHGMARSLVANMVVGVSEGFTKELEIVGVGYRAAAQGPSKIELQVGYSHSVPVDAPDGRDVRGPCAEPDRGRGHRQAARRPGRGRHPQDPQARAVQGQGHPLRRRARAAQGREVREVGTQVMSAKTITAGRRRRHLRVRKKVRGTAARPRLAVFRSSKHIYAQVIDDVAGVTIASASTMESTVRGDGGGTVAAATSVGERLAERAKVAGIDTVVFDRGGFKYHGRVAAVADGARSGGLEF